MLQTIFSNPLFYFCVATAVFGFALVISSEESFLKKNIRLALNQTGKAKMFVPLFTSIGVSFILTIILKFIS